MGPLGPDQPLPLTSFYCHTTFLANGSLGCCSGWIIPAQALSHSHTEKSCYSYDVAQVLTPLVLSVSCFFPVPLPLLMPAWAQICKTTFSADTKWGKTTVSWLVHTHIFYICSFAHSWSNLGLHNKIPILRSSFSNSSSWSKLSLIKIVKWIAVSFLNKVVLMKA